MEFHFVELSKYTEKDYKARTRFEKWLYILKYGKQIKSIEDLPKDFRDEEGIEEVINKMFEANADPKIRNYMLSYEMAELDELSRLQNAIEEEKLSIAKKLLSMNFKLEDIVTATGLTKTDILTL